jgi:hypothetical protein
MYAPIDHGRRQVVWARHYIGDHLHFGGIGNRRFHDAYDRGGTGAFCTTKSQRLANQVGVRVQGGRPEPLGKNHSARCVRPVVAGVQQASNDRFKAHHIKVVAVDDAGADLARLSKSDDGEIDLRDGAEFLDGHQVGAKVFNFGN